MGECAGRGSICVRHLGGSERGCLGGRQVYGLLRLRVAALPCGPFPWQESAKSALAATMLNISRPQVHAFGHVGGLLGLDPQHVVALYG